MPPALPALHAAGTTDTSLPSLSLQVRGQFVHNHNMRVPQRTLPQSDIFSFKMLLSSKSGHPGIVRAASVYFYSVYSELFDILIVDACMCLHE